MDIKIKQNMTIYAIKHYAKKPTGSLTIAADLASIKAEIDSLKDLVVIVV